MNTLGSNNVVFKNDTPIPAPTPAPTPATNFWKDPETETYIGLGSFAVSAVIIVYFTCKKCACITNETGDGIMDRLFGSSSSRQYEHRLANDITRTAQREFNRRLSRPKKYANIDYSDSKFLQQLSLDESFPLIDDDFYSNLNDDSKRAVDEWREAKKSYHQTILELQGNPKSDPSEILETERNKIKRYMQLEQDMFEKREAFNLARGKRLSKEIAPIEWDSKSESEVDYYQRVQERETEVINLKEKEDLAKDTYNEALKIFKTTNPISNPYHSGAFAEREDNLQRAERVMIDTITKDPGADISQPMSLDDVDEKIISKVDEAAESLRSADNQGAQTYMRLTADINTYRNTSKWAVRPFGKEEKTTADIIWKNGHEALNKETFLSGKPLRAVSFPADVVSDTNIFTPMPKQEVETIYNGPVQPFAANPPTKGILRKSSRYGGAPAKIAQQMERIDDQQEGLEASRIAAAAARAAEVGGAEMAARAFGGE